MRPTYTKELESKIELYDKGKAFSAYDFLEIGPAQTINRALSRLADEGKIRRIIQGIYDLPEYSQLLQEYTAPRIDQLAHAIARKFNWTIAPSEDIALNLLHLSTQVPAVWIYVSDGPYRNYQYKNTKLVFKHKTTREIKNMSDSTLLVIQALRGIGKDKVTDQMRKTIERFISKEEKDQIIKEAQTAPSWIFEEIKKICSESEI